MDILIGWGNSTSLSDGHRTKQSKPSILEVKFYLETQTNLIYLEIQSLDSPSLDICSLS